MGKPHAELERPVEPAQSSGAATSSPASDEDNSNAVARRALLFEHMQDGVIITNLEARIIDWNPAAERIFGYTREEMLGKRVSRLYRMESPAQLEASIIEVLEQRGRWVGELHFVRKDGTEGLCETTVVPMLGAQGRRIATIGVNRDITVRRRMETALEETYSMMRAVVDGTSDSVFVKDVDGRYVMINAACSRLAGKPMDEIVGRDDRDLFPPAEAAEIMEIDRRVMSHGEPYTFEETITISGSLRRLSTTKAPWRDARNSTIGLIGISRDVSERWEAEEVARRHREDLAHVLRVRTIGKMAAGLGHEINQPLGAIANYAEGCVRRLRASSGIDAELISALEEISAQALRAGSIVRRLGDFVRKQPARCEIVGLDSVIRAAVRMIEREVREEGIALELLLRPRLWVRVDPVQIEQVLLNVLLNGLEAMRASSPTDQARLSIRTTMVQARSARVEISDNGPGLPKGHIAQIFEPFFSTKPHGLGMGLAISRSIVEAHGGSFWAEDGHTGGATFFVQLPLAGPEELRT